MELLVLSSSAFAFMLFTILLSPVGKKIDIKSKRIDFVVNTKKEILSELDLSFYKRFVAPQFYKITEALSKRKKSKNKKTSNTLLEKKLRYAGIKIPPEEYVVIKNILVVPILIISIVIAFTANTGKLIKALILVFVLIAWILIPRYYLKAKLNSRQNSIKHDLPDVMDLLCVSIEAGLGFDAALMRISEKLEGPLIDEFMNLYRKIQMGKSRREALKDFGECSMVPELKTFASALIQADKLGISVKNILKTQSEQLRTARRQAAQEMGMKSPIKMMLPMIVFIFPVIFIILLGPIIVQLTTQLSG